MARIIVERSFDPPMTEEQEAQWARRLDPCLEVRNAAWRRTSLSTDRRHMVCEFEATDAETVREAHRTADVPFDRVWSATVYAVEDYPEHLARLEALLAKAR